MGVAALPPGPLRCGGPGVSAGTARSVQPGGRGRPQPGRRLPRLRAAADGGREGPAASAWGANGSVRRISFRPTCRGAGPAGAAAVGDTVATSAPPAPGAAASAGVSSGSGLWTCRRAAAGDLDELAAIDAACGVGWTRDQIAEELASADASRVLVLASRRGAALEPAASGGGGVDSPLKQLGGFAVAWRVADETQLLYVAVRPGLQRQGLASRLVTALLEACGPGRALLEVRAGNAAGRALYRRLGFAETGRRPRYYRGGEDAILMEKQVGAMMAVAAAEAT